MTQDEIIEMARQAGLDPDLWNYTDAFERFAVLVAQHEREACAKVCEDMSNTEANMNKTWRNGCRDAAIEIRASGQA
jgi:hypothetical protein